VALLNILRKNPIEKLSQDKLREMEIRLKVKSEKLTGEISEIEAQVQHLFQKSKEARSRLEEISLANRTKTLVQKKDMKAAAHAGLEKELRAVSNLLIIKEHEADLKATGVWEPLQKAPPEELEKYLIEIKKKPSEEVFSRLHALREEKGKIAAIEPESGEWFLGEDILEAVEKAKEKHPQKAFYFLRVGYPAAHFHKGEIRQTWKSSSAAQ
jgi:hypothetical protein